ncbi:MAG: GLUG motif-containing protein [Planctomycetota bacterium]|jgi:hypothetical protein
MTPERRSRIVGTIPLLIAVCIVSFPAQAQYSGGSGEPNDPYRIATAEDLIVLGGTPEDYEKHFILTADIDLDPNLPGGKVFDRAVIAAEHIYDDPEAFGGTSFTGYFDGNGYVISNLHIQGSRYLGLFGRLDVGAAIANLGLEAVDVNGTGPYVGGLVGFSLGDDIAASYSTGAVKGGSEVGGLVGLNSSYGSIRSSYSTCMVRGEWFHVGGLAGMNYGSISSSFSSGAVDGNNFDVGGLVGSNYGSITESYSTGMVTGDSSVGGLVGSNPATGAVSRGGGGNLKESSITASYSTGMASGRAEVGGLVGENKGSITASYSTGTASGNEAVGGLVGTNNSGSILSSYSIGAVDGNEYIGGLVGMNVSGSISDSFWDIQACGLMYSDGGTALATTQMMDSNVYSLNGWAGDPNWALDSGIDYPHLVWEDEAGQAIPEPNIDWFDGSGTEEDPFIIATADQLALLGTASILWDKSFILISDLDLSGISILRIGVCSGTDFTGIFDGDNHVVSNLTIGSDSIMVSDFGLFGCIGSGGAVRRLNLQNATVETGPGSRRVGILGGYNRGNINDLHLQNATVKIGPGSGRVGILVGDNSGNINDCNVTGSVSGGKSCIGGLVGINRGVIGDCRSVASISGESPSYSIGGLVGKNESQIFSCCAKGSVTGGHSSRSLGGLVGDSSYTRSSIVNSYASTSVSSGDMSGYLGGLVGRGIDWPGSIENCYAIGNVAYDPRSFALGGLVGSCHSTWPSPTGEAVINSFWDIETSGHTTSDGGVGLTTAEMQTAGPFLDVGWDFMNERANGTEDIWWIIEGQDYPRLWWEARD